MAATPVLLLVNVEGPLLKAISIIEDEGFGSMAARLGFDDNLRKLIRSLEDIQAALLDAEAKSICPWRLKVWRVKVDGLTGMVDDLLDRFAYEVRRLKTELLENRKKRNKVCNFFSPSYSFSVTKVNMYHRFESINSSFRSLSREARSFGLQKQQIRRTTICTTRCDALKKMLLKKAENDEELFFVSIVEMGGLSKTTLAKVLYEDDKVVNHFDERMWVCVSNSFDIDKILRGMFESLTHTVLDQSSSSREAILLKLSKSLKGKKFLLVLDDVWNEDLHLWDLFTKCLLDLGVSRGSKIMVTTCLPRIADSVKPGSRYNMPFQPMEYSWQLFQQIAFAPEYDAVKKMVLNGAEDDKELSFVSIVEMGGLSKTTLAKVLYEDDEVVHHFDVRAWVCVSNSFDIDKILKDLSENLNRTVIDKSSSTREEIVLKRQKKPKEKKFLLVLDEVWNEDLYLWGLFTESLRKLGDPRGSKILVTTCLPRIADLLKPGSRYNMPFQPEEYGWELLQQIALAPDYDAVKKMLLNEAEDDKDLFFVSIVERRGLGKTILAQLLYKDVEVVNHFDERMWVCVSEKFNTDKILKDMFESLTHTVLDQSSNSRDAILSKLQKRLKCKKVLLVLDDVWNEDLWDLFPYCLLEFGCFRGSKIMVTTQLPRIADSLKPGSSYNISFQQEKHSRELIQQIAFAPDYDVVKKMMLSGAENDKDLFFVSIVGMGGLGKTTLAQVLYKDVEVVNHFDERMWVCVSDNFDTDKILKEMFDSLTHTVLDQSSSSREAILLKLQERLKGKKILLVLDDVWSEDLHLKDLFTKYLLKPGGSRGNIIMVTTRLEPIADSLKPGSCYRMSSRPEEYSWKLFQQMAFAQGGPKQTPELDRVGRNLVKRCGGIPLAIISLGCLLYTMRNEDDWLRIEKNFMWDSNSILGLLGLSYLHLPSKSLKQCFLYCSIFPKDSVMEKEELIQLWMAQGLLNPPTKSDLSMEDLGALYLDIFMRRSFLQKAELGEFDRRKSYKMHDLVHDLALSLSNYRSIMEGSKIVGNDFEAVHVSLINCKLETLESFGVNIRKLRTLRWVNCGVLGDMLAYATSLRVLIVVDWLVEELPSSVGKLKLLHYLDISKTKIRKLPDSISKLYNLQTLKLYDLIELPKNFENLVNLKYLYIETFKDLDKLRSLPPRFQELINRFLKASFKVYLHENCPIEKLDMLLEHPERYASLRIYYLENVRNCAQATKAKLLSMSTIEHLQLHWSARRENSNDEDVLEGLKPHSNIKHLIIENYKGSTFPPWMTNTTWPLRLSNLVKMELENCSCCEQVPPLGHLPYLKIVKIVGMVSVKNIGPEFYGLTNLNDQSSSSSNATGVPTLFPELRELTIREMTCLENWSEPMQLSNYSSIVCPLLEKFEVEQCPKLIHFPDIINSRHKHLRRLEIALCDSLACLPEGLGRLQSLEDLDIRGLPSLSELCIGCCDNLKSLTIGGFSGASKADYDTQHASGSKTSLHLKGGCGKLTSLPDELQYLSALRYLTISGYGGLESLPEWFCKLRSLQILKLEFCSKLMYFPAAEKMQRLTNLDELDICYCPILEERCTKGSRPEWNKISHIARIEINSEEIKSHRRISD